MAGPSSTCQGSLPQKPSSPILMVSCKPLAIVRDKGPLGEME